uniref:Uncharacterized protein n=1 Tax=Trichuris muris TaxID=70415 RepID=A0A5S6R5T7_TRIMR
MASRSLSVKVKGNIRTSQRTRLKATISRTGSVHFPTVTCQRVLRLRLVICRTDEVCKNFRLMHFDRTTNGAKRATLHPPTVHTVGSLHPRGFGSKAHHE